MDVSDDEAEASARFALRLRKAVRDPHRWREMVRVSRDLIACYSTTPLPYESDGVTMLAIGYMIATRCKNALAPGDPNREAAEDLLGRIESYATAMQ